MNTDPDDTAMHGRPHAKCVSCGYDLRAQQRDDDCPECGTPVAYSLVDYGLAQKDPRWLSRITLGAGLLAWGYTGVLASPVLITFVLLAENWSWWQQTQRGSQSLLIFLFIIFFLANLLIDSGLWFLTQRQARQSEQPRILTLPRTVRTLATICLLLSFGWVGLIFEVVRLNDDAIVPLLFVTAIALTMLIVSTLRFIATLAGQLPDKDLKAQATYQARFLQFAGPVAIGIAMPAWMNWLGDNLLGCMFGIALLVVLLLLLVHIFLVLLLLHGLHSRLHACLEYARANASQR